MKVRLLARDSKMPNIAIMLGEYESCFQDSEMGKLQRMIDQPSDSW